MCKCYARAGVYLRILQDMDFFISTNFGHGLYFWGEGGGNYVEE